ncbi:hypothetical protein GCM10022397_47230 [Flavivirga jejuensis]
MGQQGDQNKKSVIIIGPGHGGVDSGAISKTRIKEKDVVLEVANEILILNKTLFNSTYDIYLTRYSDTLISLHHRTRLARLLKPELFISLHCNHADNIGASGVEVYLYNKTYSETALLKKSNKMAINLIKELKNKLGYRNRGVKKANFHVLRETVNICPAVLAELGFLSNSDEANHLTKERNINALALAILMSIRL